MVLTIVVAFLVSLSVGARAPPVMNYLAFVCYAARQPHHKGGQHKRSGYGKTAWYLHIDNLTGSYYEVSRSFRCRSRRPLLA